MLKNDSKLQCNYEFSSLKALEAHATELYTLLNIIQHFFLSSDCFHLKNTVEHVNQFYTVNEG